MKPLQQPLKGKLFVAEERTALWLADTKTDDSAEIHPIAPDLLFARYALVLYGSEAPLFPAFLLDDWGNEIHGVQLYKWIRRQGNLYPRAEIFGFDLQGRETQRFVREIEINDRYYCYVVSNKHAPVETGLLVHDIVIIDNTATTPEPIKPPPQLNSPLRNVKAHWYRVPPSAIETQELFR